MRARPSIVLAVAMTAMRCVQALGVRPTRQLLSIGPHQSITRSSRPSAVCCFSANKNTADATRDNILKNLRRIADKDPPPSLNELQAELSNLTTLTEAALARTDSLKEHSTSATESTTVTFTKIESPAVAIAMTVAQLKDALRLRNLPTSGLKDDLIQRLIATDLCTNAKLAIEEEEEVVEAVIFPQSADNEDLKDWLSERNPILDMELAAIARRYAGRGEQTGVFTDGSSRPNPGPGGWGVVAVLNGRVLWRAAGGDSSPDCTNNRMEITALLEALRRLPAGPQGGGGAPITIYSDSDLCVKTLTTWAKDWEKRGWVKADKKKPANLAIVQEAYALFKARPNVTVQWVRAHDSTCWNEYADVLADAARRSMAARSPPFN